MIVIAYSIWCGASGDKHPFLVRSESAEKVWRNGTSSPNPGGYITCYSKLLINMLLSPWLVAAYWLVLPLVYAFSTEDGRFVLRLRRGVHEA